MFFLKKYRNAPKGLLRKANWVEIKKPRFGSINQDGAFRRVNITAPLSAQGV